MESLGQFLEKKVVGICLWLLHNLLNPKVYFTGFKVKQPICYTADCEILVLNHFDVLLSSKSASREETADTFAGEALDGGCR